MPGFFCTGCTCAVRGTAVQNDVSKRPPQRLLRGLLGARPRFLGYVERVDVWSWPLTAGENRLFLVDLRTAFGESSRSDKGFRDSVQEFKNLLA